MEDLSKSYKLIEALRNPDSGEVRVTFNFKGILTIVKVFDPEFPDNVSIKLFDKPKMYEKTKSFWNTTEVMDHNDPEDEKLIFSAYSIVRKYFGKLCQKKITGGKTPADPPLKDTPLGKALMEGP